MTNLRVRSGKRCSHGRSLSTGGDEGGMEMVGWLEGRFNSAPLNRKGENLERKQGARRKRLGGGG